MAVDNLVEVTKLRKEFGGLVATDDVDFTIPRGRIVALIGPNGAGKTTFFNQLTGVYKPTSGSIVFDGTEVVNMPPHAITALGIGRTFQNIRLFSADERGRERPRRDALPSAQRNRRLDPEDEEGQARGARRRATAPGSSSPTPASPGAMTTAPGTFPTATSAGSRSRGRSGPTRSCSCSTSRRPG